MSFFSGLRSRLGAALDPSQLAMTQALLAGDYGAVSDMAQRWRQLQLEHERLRMRDSAARAADAGRRLAGGIRRPLPQEAHGRSGSGDEPAALVPMPGLAEGAHAAFAGPEAFDADAAVRDAPLRRLSAQEGFGSAAPGNLPPARDRPAPIPDIVADAGRDAVDDVHRAADRFKGINGYGYNSDADDHYWMSRAVFAEAAGSPEDMLAHAFAIRNRARQNGRLDAGHHGNRPTLEGVIRAPGQYPFMPHAGLPDGSALWELSGHPERMNATDRRAFRLAQDAVARALSGKFRDPTEGATHYFASRDFNGDWRTAPNDDFREGIRNGTFRRSPYRSPYQPRRNDPRAPRPSYFWQHAADFPPKPPPPRDR